MNENSAARFAESEATGGKVQLTLDAMMIYEDLRTGLRAKDVLECAARRLPGMPSLKLAIWRFDVLRETNLRKTSLEQASVAVIVLVSAHGRRGLPKFVMDWLQHWLKRKSEESRALIVSLDDTSRDHASTGLMISRLQIGARATDVAVFPHFGGTTRTNGVPAANEIRSLAHANMAVLADIQPPPEWRERWGINE